MRVLLPSIRTFIESISPKVSVMPDRFQQIVLSCTAATDERLTVISLLVSAIINIIVVGGVIILRTPLAGWAA
jgi:hypothetical protein